MRIAGSVAVLCTALPLVAQESDRDLDRPGEHHKHLTVDTVDRWMFDGAVDEVIRVDVSSGQFDPVIELVRLDESGRITDVVVPEVDDPGSESHMLARLATAGRHAILVHGPGQRGGGNYRLYVERLRSVPFPPGADHADGFLDADGVAHVRIAAERGETIVPVGPAVAELIDPMGFSLPAWEGCYDVERSGEHYVRLRGAAGAGYRLAVERGRRRELAAEASQEDELPPHGLDEWIFAGTPDAFRTLTVDGERIAVRVTAPEDAGAVGFDERPAIRWLPAHSKGSMRRFAFVTGRSGAFRVQVHSTAPRPNPYRLRFGDTSEALEAGAPLERSLPVGGARFFAFPTVPGQVMRLDVASDAFDPIVRLTDAAGVDLGENDDGGVGLACRHGWLVTRGGLVRAQVASFGDGGGGDYRIELTDVPVPELPIGAVRSGTVDGVASDHWHLAGAAGAMVFLSARSDGADMMLALFDPTGVLIGKDDDSGADRDALLAIRLPRDGRYTIEVWSRSGGGRYTLQAIDPGLVR